MLKKEFLYLGLIILLGGVFLTLTNSPHLEPKENTTYQKNLFTTKVLYTDNHTLCYKLPPLQVKVCEQEKSKYTMIQRLACSTFDEIILDYPENITFIPALTEAEAYPQFVMTDQGARQFKPYFEVNNSVLCGDESG